MKHHHLTPHHEPGGESVIDSLPTAETLTLKFKADLLGQEAAIRRRVPTLSRKQTRTCRGAASVCLSA